MTGALLSVLLCGLGGAATSSTSPKPPSVASRYVFAPAGSTPKGTFGEPVTVTRASSKSCLVGGVWTQVSSNVGCIGDAGLSVEGSRQNVALHSESLKLSPWAQTNADVSTDAAVAPNGTSTADRIFETVASGLHLEYQSLTGSLSTVYTYSIFAKPSGRDFIKLTVYTDTHAGGAVFNLAAGTVASGTGTITSAANGFYRCSVTFTSSASVATLNPHVWLMSDSATTSYAGDASKGVYLWGGQLEAGSTASSYIATTTTPVTRQADVLSVPIPAGALWAVYTLDGTRYTLDVSANASPLTIGAGQELDITGSMTDLRFCRSPIAGDCL